MPDARRVVVVGARGVVGSWVVRALTRHTDGVTRVDRVIQAHGGTTADTARGPGASAAEPPGLGTDITDPSPAVVEAVAAADAVVLALPEPAVLSCLPWVIERAPGHAAIVTTCSVQAPVFRRLREHGASHRALGVNPLFSPTLPAVGRTVAVVAESGASSESSSLVREVTERISAGGSDVVLLGPEEHDDVLSYLQVLPHAALLATAAVLTSAPVDAATLVRLAPPPARLLIDLASRVLTSSPEVYWDIQCGDRSGDRRRDLASALADLDSLVRGGDAPAFTARLSQLLAWFGDSAPRQARECAELLAVWPPVPASAEPRQPLVRAGSGVGQGHGRPCPRAAGEPAGAAGPPSP